MATRAGLLRLRDRSRGAQLAHCQRSLCSTSSNRGASSSVRLLAGLSTSPAATAARRRSSSGSGASVSLRAFSASSGRQQPFSPSLLPGRNGGGAACRAPFSSTTARPAEDGGEEDEAGEGSGGKPARKVYDGADNKGRSARRNDGDKYEDFVDLRLAEAEKLFPEGLAGGSQGSLERASTRGTSTAVLRREAADALIHSLDGFAAAAADAGATGGEGAEGGGAPPFGIEGTSSEKWRKICDAQQYGTPVSAGDEDEKAGASAADASADTTEGSPDDDVDDDDIVGDVRAAAAEGAAAAAAAAEAVTAAAVAATGVGAGEQGSEGAGGDGEQKPVLGSGPIWDEMKALAESKRQPLKGIRRVVVQPGQRSYLLNGRRGSGKSCVLNQVVLHARSTGWIVLFVPDGRNLVQKGIYCQPSPVLEGLYDLPVQSMKRLKTLRDAHGDQLKEISIKDPEVLARHAGAKTLLDVIELGLADEELAGTAHYDVMRELLATTEAKVLLAIDEYNELFQMSHWHYGDNKLEAPHLTATLPLLPPLVSTGAGLAFTDDELAALASPPDKKAAAADGVAWLGPEVGAACLPPPPANGIVVCAVSGRYPPVKKLKKKKKWTAFEEMAGRLAKAVSVPVEPYTRREFLRVLKRYTMVEEVIHEPLESLEVAKVHAKSDGLPEHVFETCRAGRYRTVV